MTLLALLAVAGTIILMVLAEAPLTSALEDAVAQQKAQPQRSAECNPAHLLAQRQPLRSFDGRWRYGVDDAGAILCAMRANKEAGKRAYLDRHFPLDMVFPFLYGPAVAALFLFLIERLGWKWSALRYLALLPLAAGAFDLSENLAVRSLVVAGLPPDAGWVLFASALTTAKSVLIYPSLVATLLLLVWYLVTRLSGGGRSRGA